MNIGKNTNHKKKSEALVTRYVLVKEDLGKKLSLQLYSDVLQGVEELFSLTTSLFHKHFFHWGLDDVEGLPAHVLHHWPVAEAILLCHKVQKNHASYVCIFNLANVLLAITPYNRTKTANSWSVVRMDKASVQPWRRW